MKIALGLILLVSVSAFAAGPKKKDRNPASAKQDFRAAFEKCLKKKGVTPPTKLDPRQVQMITICRDKGKESEEAFNACLQAKNVKLPPRPDEKQRAILRDCRREVATMKPKAN